MNADLEKEIDEIFRPRPRFVRLGKFVNDLSYLDVTDIPMLPSLPLYSKCTILFFLLSIKDRASECRIEA